MPSISRARCTNFSASGQARSAVAPPPARPCLDARDLCDKTIALFGRDLERFGALHEYYLPDNAEPVLNPGFQNWNYLVLNMIAWREGRDVVTEF